MSPYDFGITHGHRSPETQFNLYKKGRELKGDKWVKTGSVVTYKDGYKDKSKHNYDPSHAFDIVVYVNGQVTWAYEYYKPVADHVLDVAELLKEEGKITHDITWGGVWKFVDAAHFQI